MFNQAKSNSKMNSTHLTTVKLAGIPSINKLNNKNSSGSLRNLSNIEIPQISATKLTNFNTLNPYEVLNLDILNNAQPNTKTILKSNMQSKTGFHIKSVTRFTEK